MYELKRMERHLRVNLLGPGPRPMKKGFFPIRGLTKVEKHWCRACILILHFPGIHNKVLK